MCKDLNSKALFRKYSVKKVFLKFGKNHKKAPVTEPIFDKFPGVILRFY